jgi:hypothetical protein
VACHALDSCAAAVTRGFPPGSDTEIGRDRLRTSDAALDHELMMTVTMARVTLEAAR